MAEIDRDQVLGRIHASITAAEDTSGADPPADRPDELVALSLEDAQRELEYYQSFAERAGASCALRVAELLELLNRDEEAAEWWRRAAHLGDRDAIAYLVSDGVRSDQAQGT